MHTIRKHGPVKIIKTKAKGIAGIMLNNTFLKDSLLPEMIGNSGLKNIEEFTICDLNGRILAGDTILLNKSTNITSYFDDNFPSWRIDLTGEITRPELFKGFYKSFYFWTIITMIFILAFGIVIIVGGIFSIRRRWHSWITSLQ